MRLLGDTVLVKNLRPIPSKDKKLIALPEDRHERVAVVLADVIQVGLKAKLNRPIEIRQGDTVLVPNQFGTALKDGTRVYDYDDVIGIWKPK